MKKYIIYVLVIIAMIAFFVGYNDGRNDKHKVKVKSKAEIINQSNTTNQQVFFNDFPSIKQLNYGILNLSPERLNLSFKNCLCIL